MKVEVSKLCKSYGTKRALIDMDAVFDEGVYGLLGPNGAGKTTFIQMLVDNLSPDSGRILCDGRDINQMGAQWRSMIGYMPQQHQVYQNMPAERFLYYIAALKGLTKKDASEQIAALFKHVNLENVKRVKLGALSGGMKQRILIAQALLGNPKILIMDEPTAGLDPKERVRMRELVDSVRDGKIVILATHVVSDVESIADEVLFLREGVLAAKGSITHLAESLQPPGSSSSAGLEGLYMALFGGDPE